MRQGATALQSDTSALLLPYLLQRYRITTDLWCSLKAASRPHSLSDDRWTEEGSGWQRRAEQFGASMATHDAMNVMELLEDVI